MNRQILHGDALHKLKEIYNNTMDLMTTDPPYGYSIMNKNWDKAIISVDIWKECLRVLKPGAFAYVMSAPRQDVLSHMIVNLSNAGFVTNFTSIYWAYATGFPKAANISKLADKRNGRNTNPEFKKYLNEQRKNKNLSLSKINILLETALTGGGTASSIMGDKEFNDLPTLEIYTKLKQLLGLDNRFDELIKREEAQREIIGKGKASCYSENKVFELDKKEYGDYNITKSSTKTAKKLDGSYAGFQPKPAVEVILVCMKPLSEKNYTEQAMSNGKGVTWLDDCRIPFQNDDDKQHPDGFEWESKHGSIYGNGKGLPNIKKETYHNKGRFPANLLVSDDALNYDKDNFSRYFDVDKWEAQFIITPKPSKSEKNKGLDNFIENQVNDGRNIPPDNAFQRGKTQRQNTHPTVKPVSLFKYLITMGSRENDLVLDPFMGSGTTAIACEQISREWIGIEKSLEYIEIFKARLADYRKQNKLEAFL